MEISFEEYVKSLNKEELVALVLQLNDDLNSVKNENTNNMQRLLVSGAVKPAT